jgi:hypothetical protein
MLATRKSLVMSTSHFEISRRKTIGVKMLAKYRVEGPHLLTKASLPLVRPDIGGWSAVLYVPVSSDCEESQLTESGRPTTPDAGTRNLKLYFYSMV